tara:strand:- start:956 stop:2224 length:1269 start_codon:yes stop_codon:yes gene_type:complete
MNLIKNLRLSRSKNNIYQNIIFFSLILFPLAFVAGPAVMEFFIFTICLSFVLILKTQKIIFNINQKIIIILSLYLIIVLVCSFFSITPLVSLKSGFSSFRFIILIFACVYLLNSFEIACKYLLYAYVGIFFFITFDGYIQFIFSKNLFLIPPLGETKITGMFGDEKKLGSFLSRMLPILIGLLAILSKNKSFVTSFLIIFISLPLIILSHERIALVFSLITMLFAIVYFWSSFAQSKKLSALLISLIILVPILFYSFDVGNLKKRILHTKIQVTGGKENQSLVFWSNQHQGFAKTSIEIFKRNKLSGSGIKTFRISCAQMHLQYIDNCSTHPHNIFFQLLSETGLIGISFYLIILFLTIKELFLFIFNKKKRLPYIFFLLSFFFYFNPFFPSGQFFNNWYMGIGTFPLIFYFYFKINKRSTF